MSTASKKFQRIFSQYKILTLLFAIVVIWAFFGQLTEWQFLTPRNFSNLLRQMAITGMLASAMVFDCTELNAKPKAMIRKIENIVPAQRWPSPFSM